MTYAGRSGIAAELRATAGPDGMIHARTVVDWARRNPNSLLYARFEWDDQAAADQYRIEQARELIQVHIVDDAGERAYVSLSIDRSAGGGYRPVSDVMAAPNLRQIALTDALEELRRIETRYARLTELARVWQARDEAERDVKRKAARRRRKVAATAKAPRKRTAPPVRKARQS